MAQTGMDRYSGLASNGRAGTLSPNPGEFQPHTLPILHGPTYQPAVDSNGNADCQSGQVGYLLGNLRQPGQPANHPEIIVNNQPGNAGPTFAGRASVPDGLRPRSLP